MYLCHDNSILYKGWTAWTTKGKDWMQKAFGTAAADQRRLGQQLLDEIDQSTPDLSKVMELIDKGAALDEQEKSGDTALTRAASLGHEKIVALLLDKGVPIEQKNHYGKTALIRAISKGRFGVAEMLIVRGADVNAENGAGITPLIAAIGYGDFFIDLLCQHKVNLNKVNAAGNTALLWAINCRFPDAAMDLIKRGADVTIRDAKGRAALELAREHTGEYCVDKDYEDLARLIEKKQEEHKQWQKQGCPLQDDMKVRPPVKIKSKRCA